MLFKRIILLVVAAVLCSSGFSAAAQKKKEIKMWEESNARKLDPEIRMFVTPQVCDMKMLSASREIYGPYAMDVRLFYAKTFDEMDNSQLDNMQKNALYLAAKESGADAIIETVFHSWVNENDNKTVYIEVSGYPVSYYNFHPATKEDIEMIGVVYPSTNSSIMVNSQSTGGRHQPQTQTTTTTTNNK